MNPTACFFVAIVLLTSGFAGGVTGATFTAPGSALATNEGKPRKGAAKHTRHPLMANSITLSVREDTESARHRK